MEDNVTVLIPRGFRKIAESDDMYTRTKVAGYYNADERKLFFVISTDDGEKSFGPIVKTNIPMIINVLADVMEMSFINYLE